MEMKKSSRHSKITGDFAEALVLYWLSKYGYECARIDHTGIDLIARRSQCPEVMGISVKCRSQYEDVAGNPMKLPVDGFVKARQACETFGCVPFYAIVVDGADTIRCFLLALDHLTELVGTEEPVRYWRLSDRALAEYRNDSQILRFELCTTACSWRDVLV